MDVGQILSIALAAVGVLGILIAGFFGIKSSSTITQLKENNAAYKERNEQLEGDNKELKEKLDNLIAQHTKDILLLQGKVDTLEKMKTPALEPMIKMMASNHTKEMQAIAGLGKAFKADKSAPRKKS